MKVLIDIPKEIYDYIHNECMIVRCCDTHKVAEAIFYGRVLNKTEERKVDEIINPNYIHINGYAYKQGEEIICH